MMSTQLPIFLIDRHHAHAFRYSVGDNVAAARELFCCGLLVAYVGQADAQALFGGDFFTVSPTSVV